MEIQKLNHDHPMERRKKWFLIRFFLGGLLFAGLFVWWMFSGMKNNGAVIYNEPLVRAESEENIPKNQVFGGKYFTYVHPESFVVVRHEVSATELVRERLYLTEPNGKLRKVAITVEKVPENEVLQSSGIRIREINPKQYARIKNEEKEFVVRVYEKIDPMYEKTFFLIPQEGYLATISFSDPYSMEGVDELSRFLSDSFAWK